MLHIHGTRDPFWLYQGGSNGKVGFTGKHVSVCESVHGTGHCPSGEQTGERAFPGMLATNGCTAPGALRQLPNTAVDLTISYRQSAVGCPPGAAVELIKVIGGGHTWPGGWQYAPVIGSLLGIGRTSRDFSANKTIISFFNEQTR